MNQYGPVEMGSGRLQVRATAWSAGEDWIVSVQGGEKNHIGAVALACPCTPPTHTSGEVTCSVSVLTTPGHRDDVLARELALELCRRLQKVVTLSVGIHIDFAEKAELLQLTENAEAVVTALLPLLKHEI